MCDKSDKQLIEVLHGVLERLGYVEAQLAKMPELKRREAFLIKAAVDQDRAIRPSELLKRKKKRSK